LIFPTSQTHLEPTLLRALSRKRRSFRKAVLHFAKSHTRDYPWRLSSRTPFDVLIAETLLKRTTAAAAARVYPDFLRRFPTPSHLARTSLRELSSALAPIGLQSQRARCLKHLSGYLIDKEGGDVPSSLNELLTIPGVGAYSARAILSFAYNIPAAVVDSNVERILCRVFRDSLPPKASLHVLQAIADRLLPQNYHARFNFAVLDLGSLLCRPKNPTCSSCPLNLICDHSRAPRADVGLISLRRLRTAANLSLVELASRSGVSKLTIIKIEAGRTTPKLQTKTKLARVLGVNPRRLD
jgi:A/G-specific adenine glycosylase